MPSPAESIQALNQRLYPQPYAAANAVGNALGVNDAIRALHGEMTPTEAQDFAVMAGLGAAGLGMGKLEQGAVKTMGELLPHMYPASSMFAKMTPKDYLMTMGADLPKQLPADLEKVLQPAMAPSTI